jgi:hypothetical protein
MTLKLTGVGMFQFATCTRLAVEPTHPPIPWVLGALHLGHKGVVPEMLWHFTFALCTSFHSAMLKTHANSAVEISTHSDSLQLSIALRKMCLNP